MENNLLDQINKFKEDFYSKNKKPQLFKKKQKIEIAKHISENFSLDELIKKTVYNIPNTNKIILDYTIFKLFANETNYGIFLTYVTKIYTYCIEKYNSYEVHVNLKSLTPSGAERHKKCIELFNIMTSECDISGYLTNWYIYNPPSMIDFIKNLLKFVIQPVVFSKVNIIPKEESDVRLNEVLSLLHNTNLLQNSNSNTNTNTNSEYYENNEIWCKKKS